MKRQPNMKSQRFIWCGFAIMLGSTRTFAASPAAHPNIIVIYSDDHGYADLSAHSVDKNIKI